jgi:hypothetical protein
MMVRLTEAELSAAITQYLSRKKGLSVVFEPPTKGIRIGRDAIAYYVEADVVPNEAKLQQVNKELAETTAVLSDAKLENK